MFPHTDRDRSDAPLPVTGASGGDTSGDDATTLTPAPDKVKTADSERINEKNGENIKGIRDNSDGEPTKPLRHAPTSTLARSSNYLSHAAGSRPQTAEDQNRDSFLQRPGGLIMASSTNNASQPRTQRGSTMRSDVPAGRRQHPQLQSLPDRPQFSLAGSHRPVAHEPAYIDPEYYSLNPDYDKPKSKPVWGLAKPLPRVVRPGMRPGQDRKDKNGKEDGTTAVNTKDHDAGAYPIPEVDMIKNQKEGHGNERNRSRISARAGSRRSAASGTKVSATPSRPAQAPGTPAESHLGSMFDKYGTPKDEKDNPMEAWSLPSDERDRPSGASQDKEAARKMYDEAEAGGHRMSKLSSVNEVPSTGSSAGHDSQYDGESAIGDGDAEDYPYPAALEAATRGSKLDLGWVDDDTAVDQYEDAEAEHVYNHWGAIRIKFREPFAETLATMVATLIGLATNLAVQTSSDTAGNYQSGNWAWGLGIMIGIYIAGGISGGHLNPAISILLCVFRGFPAKKTGIYVAAQVTGALLAGLIAFGIYRDAIFSFDTGGLVADNTGKSFYTQPGTFAGPATSIFNEFVATAILACAVLALGDDSNAPPGAGMHAFVVGLVVTVLTMAFGYNTGACLNPARDFGPRLATAMVGYGSDAFTNSHHWWIWGPWGSTITGALTGGFLYDAAIFVGGESPINYPKRRRRRARMKMQKRWWRRVGDGNKVRELEEGIKKEMDD